MDRIRTIGAEDNLCQIKDAMVRLDWAVLRDLFYTKLPGHACSGYLKVNQLF